MMLIEELRVARRARLARLRFAEDAYTKRKRYPVPILMPEPVEDWLPPLPLVVRGAELPKQRDFGLAPAAVVVKQVHEKPLEPRPSWFFTRASDQFTYPRILAIQLVVAHHFSIRIEDIKSARRTRNVVGPRHVAFWLTRQLTDKSLPEIGRRFGGRDHTTILHGCNRVEVLMVRDPAFADAVEAMRVLLTPPPQPMEQEDE